MATLLASRSVPASDAPASAPTLQERLGYPRDARLVIVHADDLGVTHSVNAATIKALRTGLVNSASLMPSTPWFPEIAAWARDHPEADLGAHLTLTSERTFYKWGPAAPRDGALRESPQREANVLEQLVHGPPLG